ncbi:MAG: undecaprenyl/decaprenyl-phosphate alpha-N-acetylglucosaminyl 1-phosphate transferase, partial [Chloroflexi bacterium]|nr:undecaprenyl/decaprenyl-phosphate alpha-N-acetylglucosaminyl 1-phosphate transferase [Chloroflexota bacterium]
MPTLLLIFATALVLAFGGTPVARRVAVRVGIVARPGAHRAHTGTIPLLGGVAIYGAFLVALVLFADRFYVPQLISIVVGATWVSILGVLDDRVGLSAGIKLVGQLLGGLMLVTTGVTVGLSAIPVV